MPILDHINEEIVQIVRFSSLHHTWAVHIAENLNEILPEGFVANPHAQLGYQEIDVITDRELTQEQLLITQYHPTTSSEMVNPSFPSSLEIFVKYIHRSMEQTVGVIEIISEGNKDRPSVRDAFVGKCVNILAEGVSLIIVDILAKPFFNLHNELLSSLKVSEEQIQENKSLPLYCVAYRNTFDLKGELAVEFWEHSLKAGDTLPKLPLFITSEVAVPVDLERAYMQACKGLRVFERLERIKKNRKLVIGEK